MNDNYKYRVVTARLSRKQHTIVRHSESIINAITLIFSQ